MIYLEDGRCSLSNNASENSLRPVTLGRKNWLFCNTPRGAKSSAILYSIVVSAIENDLLPFEYLSYLLDQLRRIDLNDKEAIDSLMPYSEQLPDTCRRKENE